MLRAEDEGDEAEPSPELSREMRWRGRGRGGGVAGVVKGDEEERKRKSLPGYIEDFKHM